MTPVKFVAALYIAMSEGDKGAINFYNALIHGTLQLKYENPKQYFKNLLKLLNKYVDIKEIWNLEENESVDKITIPGIWDWKTIEELLTKEKDIENAKGVAPVYQ